MKREMKFRGQRKLNGDWVFGSYIAIGEDWCQIVPTGTEYDEIDVEKTRVITETVGQFTGLKDKNDKEIFEGDILVKVETDYDKWQELDYEGEEPLKRDKIDVATMDRFPNYWLENESFGYDGEDLESPPYWEIIGNIHENPELLKE